MKIKDYEELIAMNNKELLQYYRDLRAYHKALKKHVHDYVDTVDTTQKMLKYRAYDLAKTEKQASKDREDCDVYVYHTQTFIH